MPTEQFLTSVEANITYWRERVRLQNRNHLEALDRERQNLYRAVEFALTLGETRHDAAWLVIESYNLIDRRGYRRMWISLFESALSKCGNEDLRLRCVLLDRLGNLYRISRLLDASLAAHLEEEQIASVVADPYLIAKAQSDLSRIYWTRHDYGAARQYALAALDGFLRVQPVGEQIAAVYSALGVIALKQGNLEESENYLSLAVERYQEVDRPSDLARIYKDLAIAQQYAGKTAKALANYLAALETLALTDNFLEKSQICLSMGTLYFFQGDLDKAEELYLEANSEELRNSGVASTQAQVANNLASVYQEQGRLREAEKYYCSALRLWKQANSKIELANTMGGLAGTLAALGRMEEAQSLYEGAFTILSAFPDDAVAQRMLENYTKERREFDRRRKKKAALPG